MDRPAGLLTGEAKAEALLLRAALTLKRAGRAKIGAALSR